MLLPQKIPNFMAGSDQGQAGSQPHGADVHCGSASLDKCVTIKAKALKLPDKNKKYCFSFYHENSV